MLASYLTAEIGCEVCVLGIQTAVDEITKELLNLFSSSM
jgi:hypothetical protein